MSYRPRGRGHGFGRGKYLDPYRPESSCQVGRGYRGRGFSSNYQSPRFSPVSYSPPPQPVQEPYGPGTNLRQHSHQVPVSPEPVFTPQPKLDYHTQVFVDNLRQVWNLWKKSENVSWMLQEYFASVENPYETAFKIAVTCPDFYQGKPVSLSVIVIEELAVFMRNRKEKYISCLNHSIKLDVFTIFTKQRNSLLTKTAFSTYDLKTDKDIFIQLLQDLIKNHQYKEACQAATYLELVQFDIEDFVVPLLFQDKLTIAEEYLKISPKAQLETATYLDKLLQGRVTDNIDDIVRRLKIPEIKLEKLQYKPMCKLLTRFLKIYNLPPNCCSNLTQKRREGALQFVIRKRYKFNEIDGECWREMATEAVCNDPYLEEELVNQICFSGDIEEAAFFAEKFQVPFNKLPCNVVSFFKNGNKVDDSEFSPLKSVRSEQPKPKRVMTLPGDHIVTMVDTDDQLMRCAEVVRQCDLVGLDAEWKPAFNGESGILSLLQIATSHETFLVDVTTLQHSSVWRVLSRVLFMDSDILKLGFGLAMDLLKLKESIPLNDVKLTGLGYLDLNVLWKKLMREFNVNLPFKGEESDSVEGLSRLVSICLGVSLDKSEQFSNWDRRPLRDAQKCYAALDAYCLLDVYKVMQAECTSQGVLFSDVCHGLMVASANTTTKSKKKKSPYKADPLVLPPSPNSQPVRVKDVKFVCDTMLQGLGRQLRTVGVDTEILSNTQNHSICAALHREQNRRVLTKGVVFNQLRSQVPLGMCYRVEKTTSKDQLVEVLNYFNVIVTREDIFSRCQHCNGGEFKKLSPMELRRAIDSATKSCRPITNHQVGLADDDMDDYDDYGGFSDRSDDSDDLPGPVIASSSYTPVAPQIEAAPPDECEEFYGDHCRTNSGAHIKFESIPKEVFNKVPLFNICDSCGHCYWDGSHLERILGNRLKKVVAQ